MIAEHHRIKADLCHGFKIRLGILHVGFGHACIDIAATEQQQFTTTRFNVCANTVNHGFLCCHPVLAIVVFPKATVMVVGVNDGEAIGFIFDRCSLSAVQAERSEESAEQQCGVRFVHIGLEGIC